MKRLAALFVWLILVCCPAAAVPVITQLGTANGTTTAVITTGATIAAGDLIIVVATNATSGVAITSVVDSGAECTTYTAYDNAATASRPTSAIYYCANAAGLASGGSITVTGSATNKIAATAFTVSGMNTVPADIHAKQVNGASGTSATSTATGTLGAKYELVVGTLALSDTSSAYNPGAGYTSVGGISSANGSAYAAYLFNCSTSTNTYAPTWTTSRAYMSNVVSFKSAAVDAICESKTNAYPVLRYGSEDGLSASKINTYFILQTIPVTQKLPFHSFPP